MTGVRWKVSGPEILLAVHTLARTSDVWMNSESQYAAAGPRNGGM